jgi:hypothetical protein
MFAPDWFASMDIFIHGFTVLVLLLIAAFSLRFYFLKKQENKNYLFFSASFILLAISFLWKIVTDITVIYEIVKVKQVGILDITFKTIYTEKVLFVAGHLAHYLFLLLGLYILYVVLNRKSTMNHLFILYFIIITTIFSTFSYFLFHLTAFVMLLGIAYRYYWIYRSNKRKSTKLLFTSFCVLALSQVLFMPVRLYVNIYIVAQITQLIGFLILLIAFIVVMYNGKKKSRKHNK